ncbi:hypothetical protein H8959_022831 [Pygathrix nigripes]
MHSYSWLKGTKSIGQSIWFHFTSSSKAFGSRIRETATSKIRCHEDAVRVQLVIIGANSAVDKDLVGSVTETHGYSSLTQGPPRGEDTGEQEGQSHACHLILEAPSAFGAFSRGVGPKGSDGPDPACIPSISSCRLRLPWRLHASKFLYLALRPGGLDAGTRGAFSPQPLPCAAQPLPPSCIQPPALFQTCSCLVPLSSVCPGHKWPFLLADGLFQGGHQWSPQSLRHHSVLSSQGPDPPGLTSPMSDPVPVGGRLPSAAVSKLNI